MPAPQLAVLLAGSAAGTRAESAAVELIGRHGRLLRNPAFRRLIAAGSAACSSEPVAVIRWNAASWALEHGQLPCAPSDRAVLQIAASIADEQIPVWLGASLPGLGRRDTALVAHAITAASS
jgi:hypothetical protein